MPVITAFLRLACQGLLVIVLLALPLAASADNAPADGGVRATLDNGLRVVVVPNHMAPAVTTVMNYKVGSKEAPAGLPGMAHAQEHMLFRGSKNLSADQISAIAAAMGGDFNADTRQNVTQYFFTVPAQYLDVALQLEATRMRGVLDSQDLWQKERGAIEQEVARDLSEPTYVAYTKILQQLFAGTPYAHDALGTRDSFERTTGKMLKHFYRQWYAPNNAILVISGDVDPQQALASAKRQFGGIPAHDLPPRPDVKLEPVDSSPIHMPTDQGYGLALLAYRLPGFDDDDFAAARVLARALGNRRGALYSQLVPTGKALDAQFQLHGLPPASIGFGIVAFARGSDSDKLSEQARAILARIAKHGVSEDLIQAAKRQLATQEEAAHDSISDLAMDWSQALAIADAPSPAAQLAAIRQVTKADVDRVAKRCLQDGNAVLAVLTPQGSGAPSPGGGYGGKESFTPSHVQDVSLPDWAAKPLASIQPPQSVLAPRVTHLDNGLQVIVQPEHASRAIHVYGHIRNKAALQTPKGQEGVKHVLGKLLDYGTRSMDRSEYQAALDAIGAQASAGTHFSLTVLADHFARGMQLLAANELHPRLPKKAFPLVRRQVAGAVAGRIDSPDFRAGLALKQALLPEGDPDLRHATPKSVSGLQYGDVRAYYDQVFRPDLTTIVIVGDIDPDRATATVRQAFGDWRAKGEPPDVVLGPVEPNKAQTVHVPDSARTQDQVTLAQTLGVTRGEDDYDALNLGNQVLSGGFYASRLYRELRAERGLVYYIHSGLDPERKRDSLRFQFGAQPDKVTTASQLVAQALERMRKQPVSDDELHRAQAELVRRVALDEASADAIGRGILERVDLGLPLDQPVRSARHYLDMQAEDVQAVFKRWIRPDDLVRVTKGPKPSS